MLLVLQITTTFLVSVALGLNRYWLLNKHLKGLER
jgi:hypothetical protein